MKLTVGELLESASVQAVEIERLKTEQIKMFAMYDKLEQKLVAQRALITELCDVLHPWIGRQDGDPAGFFNEERALIARARDATR